MNFYEFLRSAPYVRVLLPFIFGIITGGIIQPSESLSGIIYAVLFISFLAVLITKVAKKYNSGWIWGLSLNIFLFFAGLSIFTVNSINETLSGDHLIVKGTIIENPVTDTSLSHVMVRIEAVFVNDTWKSNKSKVICTLQNKKEKNALKLNEQVYLRGYWKEIRNYGNPFEFDYKKYMNRNGFFYKAYFDSTNWYTSGENKNFKLTIWALKLRNNILNYFKQLNLSQSAFAVISALTVGDKSYLDAELKSAYVNSGTIHILAVSGMHVALLFWFLQQITRPIMLWKKGKIMRALIVLSVIWVYALITGLTPSVVRASVMFSFWMLGNTGNRNVNIYNTLSASALLLLIINPYNLFDVGFQLSYLAVLGIVVFYKDIFNWITARNVVLKYIWSMVAVSLAAQLFTLPLTLYYFHQFPNYFLLSNIVALPLSTIVLYGSIVALIIAPFKFLWLPVGWLLKILVGFMNGALIWIEHLPYSVTTGITISGLLAIALFICIISVRIYLFNRRAIFIIVIFLCIIGSMAEILYKTLSTARTKDVIVYNTPGKLLILMRDGFKDYLITNMEVDKADKLVKPFSAYYKLKNREFIDSNLDTSIISNKLAFYRNFIFFNNIKMFVWKNKPVFNKPIDVDILIFEKIRNKDLPDISKYVNPKRVIVTSGVFFTQASKLKELFYRRKIPCTVLSTDGAWFLTEFEKIDK